MTASTDVRLDTILPSVFVVRGVKAMLDADLAALYGVATWQLNQAVKRNADRFPDDFMFQLEKDEYDILRSQSVTSSWALRSTTVRPMYEQSVISVADAICNFKRVVAYSRMTLSGDGVVRR